MVSSRDILNMFGEAVNLLLGDDTSARRPNNSTARVSDVFNQNSVRIFRGPIRSIFDAVEEGLESRNISHVFGPPARIRNSIEGLLSELKRVCNNSRLKKL